MVRVQDELEGVGVVQIGIPPAVGDENARRIGVVAHDADIEVLVVVNDPDFRALGSGLAFDRFGLDEIIDGFNALPYVIGENTIEDGRVFHTRRAGDSNVFLGGCRRNHHGADK
jgi:hypothetical protein